MPPTTRRQTRNEEAGRQQQGQRTWKEYLNDIYYDPGHKGSFLGAQKLYDIIREEKLFNISLEQVTQWLNNQHTYSINKPVERKFKRNRVIVKGIDDQFDADLIVIPKIAQANGGVQYLLAVIDIFSRYGWIEPLKNKTGKLVKKAFTKIFAQGRKPRRLRTDRGSEFTNTVVQEFFKMRHIKVVHYTSSNEKQANYAERFIKTIKTKLKRYMTEKVTDKYIDVLPAMVRSYNATEHKGISEAPDNVNAQNEQSIWWHTYWPKMEYDEKRRKEVRRKVRFKYNVGDVVRIAQTRRALQREYDARWTEEVFKVTARYVRQGLPIYKLNDYDGEKMEGTFYQSELQKVTVSADKLFIVEEILKRRTRDGKSEVFVKWKGWPRKFNKWLAEDNLGEP